MGKRSRAGEQEQKRGGGKNSTSEITRGEGEFTLFPSQVCTEGGYCKTLKAPCHIFLQAAAEEEAAEELGRQLGAISSLPPLFSREEVQWQWCGNRRFLILLKICQMKKWLLGENSNTR